MDSQIKQGGGPTGEFEHDVIGRGLPRLDGPDKVSGKAMFTADIRPPGGLLCGKLLRSHLPHAKILNIDVSKAVRLLGVKGVITGLDVGQARISFVDTPRYPADQAPLARGKVRYIGDEVAAVAALDEDCAQEAIELIRVDYEPLLAVFDPIEAIKPDAPAVHDEAHSGESAWEEWGVKRGSAGARPGRKETCKNISGRTDVSFGDIEAGFASADYIREDHFETQAVAHGALEPHVAIARVDASGKLEIYISSMGIFYKRDALARALGMPLGKIRVMKSYIGGAFGGKMELFPYEYCAAHLARLTNRPLKFECTREEVFMATRQRHPALIDIKTGVTRDGRIVAQDIKFLVDNGAYRGTGPVVIFLGHGFNHPVYRVPNYRYSGISVYTNNPVRGAQRGHGAPQIRFAVDSQIDMIAEDLGLDPLEIMLGNARQAGDVLFNGDVLRSCGLSLCIKSAAESARWAEKRRPLAADATRGARKKRGIGISACSMFSGAPFYPFASAALIKLEGDGSATLYTGAVEMGQGAETTLAQVAAQELGLSLDDVSVISGDTDLAPIDMGSFLSGGALVTGNAVRLAAIDAKRQLFQTAAEILEARPDDLILKVGSISIAGSSALGIPLAKVVQEKLKREGGGQVMGKGFFKAVPGVDKHPSLASAKGRWTQAYGFCAQAAEVEVDLDTGEVDIVKVTTYHDCGFPLNRSIVQGQIHGNVSMGLGQAVFEEVMLSEGKQLNPSFLTYLMPTSLDLPQMEGSLISTIEPAGPFGAKEAGEGALASMLAAVANAVYDAVGVRVLSLPITPDKILNGLARGAKKP